MSITIIVSFLSALGVGSIISGIVIWRMKKMEKKQEIRDEARIKEGCLIFKGVRVSGKLAEETALAYKRNSANGELNDALRDYDKYLEELHSYLEKQTTVANHG